MRLLLPLLLLPGLALAGPARVDSLVGDPSGGRNHLFLHDDMNAFLNPARLSGRGNSVLLSLGVMTEPSLSLAPLGGGTVEIGPATIGLFLNRPPALYDDAYALNGLLNHLTSGGPGGAFSYTSGESVPLFLPLDLAVALDTGPVQIGLATYIALGRSQDSSELRIDEGPDFATATVTQHTGLFHVSGGVVIPTNVASPEIWLRGGGVTGWHDSLSTHPDEERPLFDTTTGLDDSGGFGGGARVPLFATESLTITPALSMGFARGTPFLLDRLDDHPEEHERRTVTTFNGVGGLGVEFAPNERFLASATVGVEWDLLLSEWDNGGLGDDLVGSELDLTSFRAPVVSIGAEGNPVGPLVLRGGIRAGLLSSLSRARTTTLDSTGDLGRSTSSSNLGATSLSASGGVGLRFKHVQVDAVAGGILVADEGGTGFFSRLDVTFDLPKPGQGAAPPSEDWDYSD